jgi:hypothetical protein
MDRRRLLKSLAGIVAGAVGAKCAPQTPLIPSIGTPCPEPLVVSVTYRTIPLIDDNAAWLDMQPVNRVLLIPGNYQTDETLTLHFDPPPGYVDPWEDA